MFAGLWVNAVGCTNSPGLQTITAMPVKDILIRAQSPDEYQLQPFVDDKFSPLGNNPAPIFRADEKINKIIIEGNTTIPATAIYPRIRTRQGTLIEKTEKLINDDIQSIFSTGWFFTVEAEFRKTSEGTFLVYRVVERPILNSVEYRGNDKVKTKYLAGITGLKKGSAFSVAANKESVRRIREYYREKGFRLADIKLLKGSQSSDRDAIFQINEGPKLKVKKITFTGNKAVSNGVLKMKLKTKREYFWFFGGKYDPSTINDDIASLKQYYMALGHFDIDIKEQISVVGKKQSGMNINYQIKEGPEYKIRKIYPEGNQVLTSNQINSMIKTSIGQPFRLRDVNRDVSEVSKKYGSMGRLYASVNAIPRFINQPGMIDLVYKINEDKVYRIGRIDVKIRGEVSHTRETVALNQLLIAPGDLADPELIRRSRRRLMGSPVWEKQGAIAPTITYTKVEDPYYASTPARLDVARGQNAAHEDILQKTTYKSQVPRKPIKVVNPPRIAVQKNGHTLPKNSSSNETQILKPDQFSNFDPSAFESKKSDRPTSRKHQINTSKPILGLENDDIEGTLSTIFDLNTDLLIAPVNQKKKKEEVHGNGIVFRAQSYDGFNNPPNPVFNQSPQGDPFGGGQIRGPEPPPNYVDLQLGLNEARTGRFMFSVGVSSDSGVLGSIVLEEQNFAISRFPTSIEDIIYGNAFRGNGEQFRIEAVPGDEVSRYTVNWTNPHFLNTDYSFGVSGFYFNRFYRHWEEQRLGGRVTLGKLLSRNVTFSTAVRMEEVNISNPVTLTVPELTNVVGSNFLSSLRLALAWDTRDSQYLPTEGEFIEGSIEQAVGQFTFTKLQLSGSTYYTLVQRADGEGRHTLAVRGQLGWTTDNTPIFERFYAGGVQTFRGYEFRGVTPRRNGVEIGGDFQLLGSIEYSMPVTANEAVRVVAFTDYGTVDDGVTFNNFRMTVGGGLRLQIPQMGPVPIALDWAIPVVKQAGDLEQLFQFYIGVSR